MERKPKLFEVVFYETTKVTRTVEARNEDEARIKAANMLVRDEVCEEMEKEDERDWQVKCVGVVPDPEHHDLVDEIEQGVQRGNGNGHHGIDEDGGF